MALRLIITVGMLVALSGGWWGWKWYKQRLARTIPAQTATGKPTLLYFTANYCAPCKFQQSPIVTAVAEELGETVGIRKIDVSASPELVAQYRILSVPATVVLNATGSVSSINFGVTPAETLRAQLLG